MRIPNNCCECNFMSKLSEMGYRYCTNPKRDKKLVSRLLRPAYLIDINCPYLSETNERGVE